MRELCAVTWKRICHISQSKCLVLVIVTYDVSTETKAGRRRLRRVAKTCGKYGQRVQKSVFECSVNEMQFNELERLLLSEIDPEQDNLRFYRITEPVDLKVKQHGAFRSLDFDGTLIV